MDLKQLESYLSNPYIVFPLIIWSIFWKGLTLWKAAGSKHITWFILIFLVNSFGLLEIAYIFYFYKWDLGSPKILESLAKLRQPKKVA